jgi:hypothetical protein
MKKVSAVEWLIEQIESCKITLYMDGDRRRLISLGTKGDLIKQAKEIEKQQLKEMYLKGIENYDPTFKKQEQ